MYNTEAIELISVANGMTCSVLATALKEMCSKRGARVSGRDTQVIRNSWHVFGTDRALPALQMLNYIYLLVSHSPAQPPKLGMHEHELILA